MPIEGDVIFSTQKNIFLSDFNKYLIMTQALMWYFPCNELSLQRERQRQLLHGNN